MSGKSKSKIKTYNNHPAVYLFSIIPISVALYFTFDKNIQITAIGILSYTFEMCLWCFTPKGDIKSFFYKLDESKTFLENSKVINFKTLSSYFICTHIIIDYVLYDLFLQHTTSEAGRLFIKYWKLSNFFVNGILLLATTAMVLTVYIFARKERILNRIETFFYMLNPFLISRKKYHMFMVVKRIFPENTTKEQKNQLDLFSLKGLRPSDVNMDDCLNVGRLSNNLFFMHYAVADGGVVFSQEIKDHIDEHNKSTNPEDLAVLTAFDEGFFANKTDGIMSYEYGEAQTMNSNLDTILANRLSLLIGSLVNMMLRAKYPDRDHGPTDYINHK